MNATIVISTTSVLVGLVCFAFFLLASKEHANKPIWGIIKGTEEGSEDEELGTGTIWFSRDESGVVSIKIPDDFDPSSSSGSYHVLTKRPGQFYEEVVRFDYDSNNNLTKCEGDHVDHIAEYEKFTSKVIEAADNTLLVEFTDEDITHSPKTIHLEYEVTVGTVPAHISGLYEPATLEECQAFWETGQGERRRALQAESVLSGKPVGQLEMEQNYLSAFDAAPFDDEVNPIVHGRRLGYWGGLAAGAYNGGYCVDNACVTKHGSNTFAFRGSDDGADWYSNLWSGIWDTSVGGHKMHHGFVDEFNRLRSWVQSNGGSSSASFVGHSLGGGIATVAAEYFGGGTVVTFGAPAPYSNNPGCVIGGDYRTYHKHDLVPYAASIIGYEHGQNSRMMYTSSSSCGKGCTRSTNSISYGRGCNGQPSFWDGLGFSGHSMDQYRDWSGGM